MQIKKHILVVLTCITVSAILYGFSRPSESSKGFLIMRTTESVQGASRSTEITVVNEDGQVESHELNKMKLKELSSNIPAINKKLNELRTQNYGLVSMSSTTFNNVLITTYVLEK